MAAGDDKVQIGLTKQGDEALETLTKQMELLTTEGDAYKLAVAYALGKNMQVSEAPERGYGTKFNATGGLDRDGTLRDLIVLLRPEYAGRPYANAERLAELGVTELAKRLTAHETLADILTELATPTAEVEAAVKPEDVRGD